MVQFLVGFLILAGTVGADDFALEAGVAGPPLAQTILFCLIGMAIMLMGVSKMLENSEN